MSLLHTIVFNALMKNKKPYDPANPRDYAAERKKEIAMVSRIRVPKGVTIREEALGGVPAQWITSEQNPSERIVLYIHGGGFVTGSSEARKGLTYHIAHKLGLNVVAIDYRLAPEHPFPAGPEDCLKAYEALLKRFDGQKIVLLGESAGGNLVLSLLLQVKAKGLPLPAGTFALSPTVQYDQELSSYRENVRTDCILDGLSDEVVNTYLGSRDEAVMKDPFAAPLYGDYRGCTPVVLWASEAEMLLDDSVLLFGKLKEQGVPTKLYTRKGMMHAWMIVPQFGESRKDLKVMGEDMKRAFANTLKSEAKAIRRD